MSIYKEILDNMTWSYSRLSAYEDCPYCWYRKYIEGETGEGTFYADNGKAMHEVFDCLAKGEIDFADAPSVYLDKFELITNKTKQNVMDKTFDSCVKYLCEIDEGVLDGYEIVASELELNFKVGKYDFVGYIDLLLRSKDGQLIIVDHKSCDPFFKANGGLYAKGKEQYEKYMLQQGLYCIGVKQMYGELPTKVVFHHFKSDGKLSVTNVNEATVGLAGLWAESVIEKIYSDEAFEAKPKTGYCYRLCDFRRDCDYVFEEDDEKV